MIDIKMPSITELQFPKMRSKGSIQELKSLNNMQSLSEKSSFSNTINIKNKMIRSYSMSLLNNKKDIKILYSPKKIRFNFSP
jgi:hypothetical protein